MILNIELVHNIVRKDIPQFSGLTEYWADIPEYEGLYQVSNFGRVKSLDRYVKYSDTKKAKRKGKFKSLRTEKDGYLIVDLYRGKDSGTTYRYKTFKVHRLVALSFIHNPDNLPEVNHLNKIRDDNKLVNLEWTTTKENIIHSHKNGIQLRYKPGTGVYKTKHNSWLASIRENGKRKHLGSFPTKEEALKARDIAEGKYYRLPAAFKAKTWSELLKIYKHKCENQSVSSNKQNS